LEIIRLNHPFIVAAAVIVGIALIVLAVVYRARAVCTTCPRTRETCFRA
jgi:hypothetical protein